MERSVDVATGESVVFSYELAGLGSRFLAVALDLTLQLAVAAAALGTYAWLASAHPGTLPASAVKLAALDKITRAALIALITAALFLVFFGYFIFFEWWDAGRTPGKRALGIRVVRDGGFPIDFTAAVVRNVLRILEFGLGFYAVSAVCTLLSPLNRRLGDMAAGTIVVREHRFERLTATSLANADRERDRDDVVVAELSLAQRNLVRSYVERRASLRSQARRQVAASIAASVRPKLGASFEHLDDDDLLVHLAASALSAFY